MLVSIYFGKIPQISEFRGKLFLHDKLTQNFCYSSLFHCLHPSRVVDKVSINLYFL